MTVPHKPHVSNYKATVTRHRCTSLKRRSRVVALFFWHVAPELLEVTTGLGVCWGSTAMVSHAATMGAVVGSGRNEVTATFSTSCSRSTRCPSPIHHSLSTRQRALVPYARSRISFIKPCFGCYLRVECTDMGPGL